jgi:hypothetical protein
MTGADNHRGHDPWRDDASWQVSYPLSAQIRRNAVAKPLLSDNRHCAGPLFRADKRDQVVA